MIKDIMNIIPLAQSIQLIDENLKVIKKKKVKSKDLIKLGMKNIVGTSLIKVESNLIAGL